MTIACFEGRQSIGRIRFAEERMPPIWLWNINVHLTGGLPMGQARDNGLYANFDG